MKKRFIFSLFSFCLITGILHVELNVGGLCNPNYDLQQYSAQNGNFHTNHKNLIEVIKTEPHLLILRFRLPPLEIQKIERNAKPFTQIRLQGADWTTETGKPKLPKYTYQIGLPTSSTATVTLLQKQSAFKKVEHPLITNQAVDPLIQDEPQIDGNTPRKNIAATTNKLYPKELVEVIPVGFVRSQRIGALHIHPVQYNSATQQIKITDEITFRIDFYGAPAAVPTPPSINLRESATYENMFQSMLINNAQASAWRQRQRAIVSNQNRMNSRQLTNTGPMAPAAPTATRRRFKMSITQNNMYRISYNNLKSAGVTPEDIDLDSILLHTGEQRQGFYIFDRDQNDTLNHEDMIVFYGRGLVSNKFTDTNIYWLSFTKKGAGVSESATDEDDTLPSRISTRSATPINRESAPPRAFLTKRRFEENLLHDSLNGNDVISISADHYFWTGFRGGSRETSQKDFPVELPRAIPRLQIERDAILRIRFQGASSKGAAKHLALIQFNGRQFGKIEEWRRQNTVTATRNISQQYIHHDFKNYLQIHALDDNDTPEGSHDFYVDWYEFEYWRDFRAGGNRLAFNSITEPVASGKTHFNITNFSSEDIDVYTYNQNGITAKLVDARVTRSSEVYNLLFEDEVEKDRRTNYFAIANNAYHSIGKLTEVPPSDLRNPTTQVDYIVITHKTFLESIQPLVEYRRSQGLTVKVVDIEEIYDEFRAGLFNPLAIQDFLRYAYEAWQPPVPTYVLLVGDAHYDYKRVSDKLYQGTFNLYPNFVPTYHGWAPASGETSMDQRFVNVSGDDALPDMIIGRLPVQKPDELTKTIKKIIDYEENPIIGPWQATLVQVADNHTDNPNDGVFEESRDDLIREIIPLAYHTKQLYLRKIRYRQNMLPLIRRAFNDGALVVEYAGHGGNQTWADERIFALEHVSTLRNKQLPFVVTTTCLNGEFDRPQPFGRRCLSEEFLISEYGAIASLAATRLTYATANAEFDRDLFTVMFEKTHVKTVHGQQARIPPNPSIGKIVNDAKIRNITRTTNLRWIQGTEQYTLFGDPATPLALPTLDIQVKLDEIALNPSKQIVILNNEVGTYDADNVWWKAEDFSTEKNLTATAIFHNHFDDEHGNEITTRDRQNRVWQGEYGTIRLEVPDAAVPGRGVVQLLAYNDTHVAAGGAPFWVKTPIIIQVLEQADVTLTDTLNVMVLVVDDLADGQGIKDIYVKWHNTFQHQPHDIPMVKTKPPPGAVTSPKGGQWYELKTPIPLPKGGREIKYQILVTDTSGLEIVSPSKTERHSFDVPEGPNIKVGTDGDSLAPVRYIYNEETEKYYLVAELVNSGGRTVKADIEVIFSEGNPDIDGNWQVDEAAVILAEKTVHPTEWEDGTNVYQRVTVTAPLKEALSTGAHKIYVLANPDRDTTDDIIGTVAEPNFYDNKHSISFIVNEYYYDPSQSLTAYSLDRVFDIMLPDSVAQFEGDNIPLSISSSAPFTLTQPSFNFAPIPRVAALRRGLIRAGEERAQQYEVSFRTSNVTLKKPVTLKLRFDFSALEDIVRENTPWKEGTKEFRAALIEEAEKLGIYAWQAPYKKWKRLPSQVNYATENEKPKPDEDGPIFKPEVYVTPIQTENANKQPIPIENIKIFPYSTTLGTWVIVFLDSTQFEVYIKRRNAITVYKLDQIGQLDIPYRDDIYGIEFTIPKKWEAPPELDDGSPTLPFEFGDILIFKTDRPGGGGNIEVVETRNKNVGNGTAVITAKLGPKQEFVVGDWFLFFTSPNQYEIRDKTGAPVYSGDIIARGVVNKRYFVSHLGLEIHVNSSTESFTFGDKIKFSTAHVASITAQATELAPFTLISGDDTTPPTFELWVDGLKPQVGSVIAPRPLFSILLKDVNGVNLDTLVIRRGDNGSPLKPINDYVLRNRENFDTIPIDYKPILFPGEYAFEIEASDFNGNAIGGDAEKIQTRFVVTEMPDITPPVIEILVNDEVLLGEVSDANSLGEVKNMGKNRITQQPQCEIRVTDETALDNSLLNITFNRISTDMSEKTRRYREFDTAEWVFDIKNPETANFSFTPDLSNGTYQIKVTATDTSENTAELGVPFTLEEAVTFSEKVFNVPNPINKGKTDFIYQLTQPPDKVTIKIYTVTGRLIRTIVDESAKRGNNETFWDGKDEIGVRCANGVYLYRVIAHTGDSKVEKIGKLAILR